MGQFISGVLCGILGLLLAAFIATHEAKDVCSRQNWSGAACQCRIILGYDDAKP